MIEVIYNKVNTDGETIQKEIKIPKNIRQIGSIEDHYKIYIEDYVMTFVNRLIMGEEQTSKVVIFLGQAGRQDGSQYVFINGAVEADQIEINKNNIYISEDAWSSIYELMHLHFENFEVMGWMLFAPEMKIDENDVILKAHIDNFAGNDKVLFFIDQLEQDEAFYLYANHSMEKQKGYYIYYEKNEQMQEYMVSLQKEDGAEKEIVEDNAAKNFRSVLQEKQETVQQKKMMGVMYSVSTFLVMVVCVIGITMMNNYDKMRSMEKVLNTISSSVNDEKKETTTDGGVNIDHLESGISPNDQQNQVTPENTPQQPPADPPVEETPPVEAATVPPTPEYQTHTVQKGDTLASISRQYYSTIAKVEDIRALNEINNGDSIKEGQVIKLP